MLKIEKFKKYGIITPQAAGAWLTTRREGLSFRQSPLGSDY